MKLSTDIKPRLDGTVKAVTDSGKKYEFKPDKDGRLVADVTDQGDLEFLLDAGFFPADEADIGPGIDLMVASEEPDDEDPPADDEGTPDSAPVEANTPPKPKGKGKK